MSHSPSGVSYRMVDALQPWLTGAADSEEAAGRCLVEVSQHTLALWTAAASPGAPLTIDKFSRAWEERVEKQLVKGWGPSVSCELPTGLLPCLQAAWKTRHCTTLGSMADFLVVLESTAFFLWFEAYLSRQNPTNKSAKRQVCEAALKDALRRCFAAMREHIAQMAAPGQTTLANTMRPEDIPTILFPKPAHGSDFDEKGPFGALADLFAPASSAGGRGASKQNQIRHVDLSARQSALRRLLVKEYGGGVVDEALDNIAEQMGARKGVSKQMAERMARGGGGAACPDAQVREQHKRELAEIQKRKKAEEAEKAKLRAARVEEEEKRRKEKEAEEQKEAAEKKKAGGSSGGGLIVAVKGDVDRLRREPADRIVTPLSQIKAKLEETNKADPPSPRPVEEEPAEIDSVWQRQDSFVRPKMAPVVPVYKQPAPILSKAIAASGWAATAAAAAAAAPFAAPAPETNSAAAFPPLPSAAASSTKKQASSGAGKADDDLAAIISQIAAAERAAKEKKEHERAEQEKAEAAAAKLAAKKARAAEKAAAEAAAAEERRREEAEEEQRARDIKQRQKEAAAAARAATALKEKEEKEAAATASAAAAAVAAAAAANPVAAVKPVATAMRMAAPSVKPSLLMMRTVAPAPVPTVASVSAAPLSTAKFAPLSVVPAPASVVAPSMGSLFSSSGWSPAPRSLSSLSVSSSHSPSQQSQDSRSLSPAEQRARGLHAEGEPDPQEEAEEEEKLSQPVNKQPHSLFNGYQQQSLFANAPSSQFASAPGGPMLHDSPMMASSSPSFAPPSSSLRAGSVLESSAVVHAKDAPRCTSVYDVRVFSATETAQGCVPPHCNTVLLRTEPASAMGLLGTSVVSDLARHFGALTLNSLHVAAKVGPASLVRYTTAQAARNAVASLDGWQMELVVHGGASPSQIVLLRAEFVRDDEPGAPALVVMPHVSVVMRGQQSQAAAAAPSQPSFVGLPADFASSPHHTLYAQAY